MLISTTSGIAERYEDPGHFVHVLSELLVPAAEPAGFEAVPPSAESDEVIQATIMEQYESADLVLDDLSTLNLNVMFELGIPTALNRRVRLIRDDHTPRRMSSTSY